jgi:periplasmic divalent cation tolerance protein
VISGRLVSRGEREVAPTEGSMERDSTDETETLLVFTTLPDRVAAMTLAHAIVGRRLAACVNILAASTSVYRWNGAIEEAGEIPLLMKTRSARYPELQAAIRELHPYELPEIIAVPAVRGLPEYLDWIAEETAIPIG